VKVDLVYHSGDAVISFSHFLPRLELCPEKRFLHYQHLPKAVGSHALGERVAALRPDVHVFGHTHFGWDMELDGVRYMQAALAYPYERELRMRSLMVRTLLSTRACGVDPNRRALSGGRTMSLVDQRLDALCGTSNSVECRISLTVEVNGAGWRRAAGAVVRAGHQRGCVVPA
jgi:hypothetical protein